MKFLCPSCKAKYQIADEKIGGRTLKMDCRRCGHAIVIKGDAPEASDVVDDAPPPSQAPNAHASRAPARPATRSQTAIPPQGTGNAHQSTAGNVRRPAGASRSGSSAGPFPQQRPGARSALGAEFRRTATSAPVEPPRATPLDQWHVAINDVPVGPMRRDEVARKIAIGAITPESLAWREGFDDWRPVKDIQELSVLLRRGGEGGTPSQRPGAPAPARAGASATGQQKPLPGARPPTRGAPPRPGDRAAARSNVVPIGGRLGAAAAPTIDAEDELDAEPTQIASAHEIEAARHVARKSAPPPSVAPRPRSAPSAPEVEEELDLPIAPIAAHAPLPAMTPTPVPFAAPPVTSMPVAPVAPAQRERRGLPVGAWIAIVGAGSFGAVLALAIAYRVIFPPAAVEPAAAVASVQPTPPPTAPPPVPEAPVAVDPPATDTTAEQPEQPEQHAAAETTTSSGSTTTPRTGSGGRTGSHGTTTTTSTATGAGSATKTTGGGGVFDQYADEGTGGMARIAGSGTHTGEQRATRSELTAEQISAVVTRERRGLQDCWERAIRGARDVPAVRLDVSLTIGTSGIVTRAQARGNIPSSVQGDLQGCIETRVRRWHFPPSSGETETNFPLVFTGT